MAKRNGKRAVVRVNGLGRVYEVRFDGQLTRAARRLAARMVAQLDARGAAGAWTASGGGIEVRRGRRA